MSISTKEQSAKLTLPVAHYQAWATGHEEYNHEAWTAPRRDWWILVCHASWIMVPQEPRGHLSARGYRYILLGGLEHEFYEFPFSWEESSQLTKSYFFRGVVQPPTSYRYIGTVTSFSTQQLLRGQCPNPFIIWFKGRTNQNSCFNPSYLQLDR